MAIFFIFDSKPTWADDTRTWKEEGAQQCVFSEDDRANDHHVAAMMVTILAVLQQWSELDNHSSEGSPKWVNTHRPSSSLPASQCPAAEAAGVTTDAIAAASDCRSSCSSALNERVGPHVASSIRT
ncbi:hypothetical protein MRX96_038140 [Rhipicephalus microplus]